ncbi:MAG: hypothetical protein ACPG52_08865 [Cognaticolwellia sp.]
MTDFIPHGRCSYSVENNIVIIDATGPWNLEFFQQMHHDLARIIFNDVDYNNFAILLILNGDSLAVQDGLDYHLNLVKDGPTKALAINTSQSNAPKITEALFTAVYDQAGLLNKSFDSTAEAKVWLTSQLS